MKQYDIVILGGGPGGYVSAIRAAQLGAKVALIEKNKVGGTCLNVGCIPTKALMKNVEILHYIEQGTSRGIKTEGVSLDLKKAIKSKNKAVRQLVGGVEGLLASNGVDVYYGQGCVEDKNILMVKLNDSEEEIIINYDKLIIATGSCAAMPPIKGIDMEGVVTSTELLDCTEAPEHLIIIGGGVIGCELASIFRAYGSGVSIVELMPALGSGLDYEMSSYLQNMMESQEVEIYLEKKVTRIEKDQQNKLVVVIENKDGSEEKLLGDKVLVSVGRRPMLVGLEKLELETVKGFIDVNEHMETSVPGVYAIGDVTGKRQLAHVAEEMGVVAVENAIMSKKQSVDFDMIPACIYTIPEMASIGMTETQAKERGFDIVVGKFPLMACGKAVATGDDDGMFKIIFDRNTKGILGAHLIGKSSTELIAEMAAYMKMGATMDDIIETVHSHPTISEAIAEAARCAKDGSIHMPKGYRG